MGLISKIFKNFNQTFLNQDKLALANEYSAYVQAYSNNSDDLAQNNQVLSNTKAFIVNASFSQTLSSTAQSSFTAKPLHVMMLGLRGFPNEIGRASCRERVCT